MNTNTNTNNIQQAVSAALESKSELTPYELAGVASKLAGRYVREQMVYQYVAKGFINSTVGSKQTKNGSRNVKVVLRNDAEAWLVKYLTKNS